MFFAASSRSDQFSSGNLLFSSYTRYLRTHAYIRSPTMPLVDIDYFEGALDALRVLNAGFSFEAIRGPVDACLRFVKRLFLTIFDIAYLMEQYLVHTYLRFLTGFLLFLLNTGTVARRFALLEHRRCETQQDKWTAQVEAWWNEVNFKNFKKLLRVFNLIEPLPTDLIPVNTFLPVKKPKRQTR